MAKIRFVLQSPNQSIDLLNLPPFEITANPVWHYEGTGLPSGWETRSVAGILIPNVPGISVGPSRLELDGELYLGRFEQVDTGRTTNMIINGQSVEAKIFRYSFFFTDESIAQSTVSNGTIAPVTGETGGIPLTGRTLLYFHVLSDSNDYNAAVPLEHILSGNAALEGHTFEVGSGEDNVTEDNQTIRGSDGNDTINGSNGADLLIGRAGNDIINPSGLAIFNVDAHNFSGADAAEDTMTGGAGNDTFVIDKPIDDPDDFWNYVDTITDFEVGDTIELYTGDYPSDFYSSLRREIPKGDGSEVDFGDIVSEDFETYTLLHFGQDFVLGSDWGLRLDGDFRDKTFFLFENSLTVGESSLFTTEADSVNFSELTSEQSEAISAGAGIYDALAGNDTVVLPDVQTLPGNRIFQTTFEERFNGGDGMDTIYTGGLNDWIDGEDGDDTIYVGASNTSYFDQEVNHIWGGDGMDRVIYRKEEQGYKITTPSWVELLTGTQENRFWA